MTTTEPTPGERTRERIVEATLETLRTEGIVGTSARAIARAGDFNQALIFYHFGSVDDLIVAAVAHASSLRIESHREPLAAASSLPELLRVARQLHDDDRREHAMTVLTQAFAGSARNDEMGPKLYAALEPWTEMVAESIDRVVGATNLPVEFPRRDTARAISALFLGIELLDQLDPSQEHARHIFEALEQLAGVLDDLLNTPIFELLRGE